MYIIITFPYNEQNLNRGHHYHYAKVINADDKNDKLQNKTLTGVHSSVYVKAS